jgi:hypothetical protein
MTISKMLKRWKRDDKLAHTEASAREAGSVGRHKNAVERRRCGTIAASHTVNPLLRVSAVGFCSPITRFPDHVRSPDLPLCSFVSSVVNVSALPRASAVKFPFRRFKLFTHCLTI